MKEDLPNISDTYFIYTSKEVAEKVGIKTPTVRKYGQLLEKYGYEFEKNGDRRNFVHADVLAMKKMKESSNIEETAKALAKKQKEKGDINDTEDDTEKSDISVSPPDMELITKEFQIEINKMEMRYNELVKSIGVEFAATREVVESISYELEESRKREEMYKQSIDDMNEKLNKAVDLLMKFEEKQENEDKKGFWKRIFG